MTRDLIVIVTLAGAPQLALADDCAPYDPATLTADLDAVSALLETVDLPGATTKLEEIHGNLVCVTGVAPRPDLARFGRAKAVVAFLQQDEDTALRWSRMAKYAWPAGPWPSIIAEGHPLTMLTEDMGPPLWGGPEGKQFIVGRGGAAFANGVFLPAPRLASEVPFLVQIFDRRGELTGAYWQDGAAFREDALEDGTDPLTLPEWYIPLPDAPAPGLGEAESFQSPAVTFTPEDGDDPEDIPDEPTVRVDDRPLEVRAREAWERAIGVADLNEDKGIEKLTAFLETYGDSGIPELADAHEWMAAHAPPPVVEPPVAAEGVATDTPDGTDDGTTDATLPGVTPDMVSDDPPPRERPEQRVKGHTNGLRVASYVAAGTALALYGGAWGARASYNGSPTDGKRGLTNGLVFASAGAAVGAAVLFPVSFTFGAD